MAKKDPWKCDKCRDCLNYCDCQMSPTSECPFKSKKDSSVDEKVLRRKAMQKFRKKINKQLKK